MLSLCRNEPGRQQDSGKVTLPEKQAIVSRAQAHGFVLSNCQGGEPYCRLRGSRLLLSPGRSNIWKARVGLRVLDGNMGVGAIEKQWRKRGFLWTGVRFRGVRDSWVSLNVQSMGLVHCPLLENPSSGERQMTE